MPLHGGNLRHERLTRVKVMSCGIDGSLLVLLSVHCVMWLLGKSDRGRFMTCWRRHLM
jgi:hypothetical protein